MLDRVHLADRAQASRMSFPVASASVWRSARALILHPEILLLDEITAALDPEMVHEVLEVVVELADAGQTMLIVTLRCSSRVPSPTG